MLDVQQKKLKKDYKMCGIAGYVSFSEFRFDVDIIKAMTNALIRRGPDDYGFFSFDTINADSNFFKSKKKIQSHVAFGHRRLSIIDLTTNGRQPMKSGKHVIVFNGEIYNYIELKQELQSLGVYFKTNTDTEVILRSYNHWGNDCFKKFNGMWSLAIYNTHDKKLLLSRDRMGKKPLYYYKNKKTFIFSSELKSLFKNPLVVKKPNFSKIYNYVGKHYRYVDNDNETFFENVFQVPKSSYFEIDCKGNSNITKFWSLKNFLQNDNQISLKDAKSQFSNLLESSIRLRLRSDVPVGVFLSGGLDSTSIAAIAKANQPNIKTISSVSNDKKYSEKKYIDKLVINNKLNHSYIDPVKEPFFETLTEMIEYHDQPICTSTWFSMYLLCKNVSDLGIKVVLTGHGGDELLAGYWDHYHYHFYDSKNKNGDFIEEISKWKKMHKRDIKEYDVIEKKILKFYNSSLNEEKSYIKYNKYLSKSIIDKNNYQSDLEKINYKSHLTRRLYSELNYETVPASLRAEDMNFMKFSLENRVPFLDHRLIEFCFSLKNNFKIKNGLGKHLLRKSLQNKLPNAIRLRKDKMGHNIPFSNWIRFKLKNQVEEIINQKNFLNSEIYLSNNVKTLFDKHCKGENHEMFFWQYLNMHYWLKSNFNF